MIHFYSGNQVTLLRNGTEYFPALEAAIDSAQHEIYLQAYIYEADDTGLRIGAALKRAAQRSVSVNLLLDGFGSKSLPKDYVEELQTAGVEVMFYRPKISPLTLKRGRLRRLHVKVIIIDGRTAFIGGINIIDDMDVPTHHDPHNIGPRIDYVVSVEGSLLPTIHAYASRLWRHITWSQLKPVHAYPHLPGQPTQRVAGNMRAAFVIRDNVLHRRDIEHAYLIAIAKAKSEIIIANAYFIPGRRFRKALLTAARRGVRVRLLLQGRMEYFVMFATHAFYSVFLRNGIEIYEYRKSFMHSKVGVVDGQWATVGSSNIDPFSLLLAREANIVVQDSAFAAALRVDIEHSITDGAHKIQPEDWENGHIIKRVVSWIVYGLVRLALGIVGYPNKH